MDLKDLRDEIDDIDEKILALFAQRMGICRDVAAFKKANNLAIMQSGREQELISRVKKMSPEGLENGTAVLFTNIMDISKSLQQQEISANFYLSGKKFSPEQAQKIGCQGVRGSYQEQACQKLFGGKKIEFFHTFEDVFKAVDSGFIDFGVLPIQNSTAGSVAETYDLMRKYNFFISARIEVEISHCLAAKNGVNSAEIKEVYSHEQALSQCSEFIAKNGFEKISYLNTAAAAELVKSSSKPIAAICSEKCAELYGLKILQKNIANVTPNSTRFICISKDFFFSEKADTVSISLAVPNVKGSLYRLLTKFSVNDLDLEHIESKPILDGSFDAIFYLDFKGNISEKKVGGILNELQNELTYFKFLGNYFDII
ncbi:MAG: prephenate dehydratase domain-containing protein [Oscillospiraceae bacterium]